METEKNRPRKNWSAPHDGVDASHYLGNDESPGASLPEEKPDAKRLQGKVAHGNLDIPEEDTFSEEEKESGKSL